MKAIDIQGIANQFQFEGTYQSGQLFGFGHINDTYLIVYQTGPGTVNRYILQRINHTVFKNPAQVMENIERVTEHLRGKIMAVDGDHTREVLTLVNAQSGNTLHKDATGDFWRAYHYIEDSVSYDDVETPDQAFQGAHAFARFQQHLIDFDAQQLHETIPNFHHTPQRFLEFMTALEADVLNRAGAVQDEIEFVLAREAGMSQVVDLLQAGSLPLRVTHNDTKFNNVMFDVHTGLGVCVVDLDTVMPGSSLYDFGDAIRSGAKRGGEDEPDLSKVGLDLEIFDAYTRGYLDVLRDVLTPLEIDLMPASAELLTLECGMRFLTDYLVGDVYYKTRHAAHNLDRCRTQFKLVTEIEQCRGELQTIVEKYR